MDIFKTFGTDKKLEKEGAWHNIGDGKVKVARIGNQNYQQKLSALYKENPRKIRSISKSKDSSLEDKEFVDGILYRAMAFGILVDWKNISFKGKDLPYTEDNAFMLLKEIPDFRDYVTELATSMENFQQEADEEAEKNLPKPSTGN